MKNDLKVKIVENKQSLRRISIGGRQTFLQKMG